MIVQCDKCKTKFRIAEDKVSENGVRVRCSRCAHVFTVRRLGAPLPEAAAETPAEERSTGAPAHPSQLSELSVLGSSLGAASHGPYPIPSAVPSALPTSGPEIPPSAPRPINIPKVATTQDAMVALGFAPAPKAPPPPPTPLPAQNEPFDVALDRALGQALDQALDHALDHPLAFDDETTAVEKRHAALRSPPSPPLGPAAAEIEMSRAPLPPPPPLPPPDALSMLDMLADPATVPSPPRVAEVFDAALAFADPFSSPGAPPAPGPSPVPKYSGVLKYSDAPAYQEAPPTHREVAPVFPEGPLPFGELPSLSASFPDSIGSPAAAMPAADVGGGSELNFDEAFGAMTTPFFPPPPGMTSGHPAPPGAVASSAPAHLSGGGDLPDIPGLFPLGLSGDDPFAGLDLGTGNGYAGGDLAPPPIHDLAVPPSPPSGPPSSSEGPRAQLGRIDLGRAALPVNTDHSARTRVASTLPLPDAVYEEMPGKTSDRIGPWPTYVGFAAGLLIVIMAVTGPVGGSLSKLGPGDIAALVSPRLTEPLVEAVREVKPRGAHVTTYVTRTGKKLLVVAGEAYNAGREDVVGLEAVAMIINGRDVLDRRDAWVGVVIGEDVLASVETPADLEAAYGNAIRAQPKPVQDLALKPGTKLPFMVVFPEPPNDLEHRSFHVEFRKGALAKSVGNR